MGWSSKYMKWKMHTKKLQISLTISENKIFFNRKVGVWSEVLTLPKRNNFYSNMEVFSVLSSSHFRAENRREITNNIHGKTFILKSPVLSIQARNIPVTLRWLFCAARSKDSISENLCLSEKLHIHVKGWVITTFYLFTKYPQLIISAADSIIPSCSIFSVQFLFSDMCRQTEW